MKPGSLALEKLLCASLGLRLLIAQIRETSAFLTGI